MKTVWRPCGDRVETRVGPDHKADHNGTRRRPIATDAPVTQP